MRARLQSIATYLMYAGLLALAAGSGLYFLTRQFNTTVEVLLALGLALVGLFILLRPDPATRASKPA